MSIPNRFSIIGVFVLATLLTTGSVEFFCRALEHALTVEEQSSTTTSGPAKAGTVTTNPVLGKTSTPQENSINYTIISKRSLFGKVQKKTTETPSEAPPFLENTSLDLILLGTISGGANEQRAIIQDKRKKTQDIYYQGDAIGPALIKEILRGKIILTVGGKDEILLMKEPKSSSSRRSTAPSSPVINHYKREKPEPEPDIEELIEYEDQTEEFHSDFPPPVAEGRVKGRPGGTQ